MASLLRFIKLKPSLQALDADKKQFIGFVLCSPYYELYPSQQRALWYVGLLKEERSVDEQDFIQEIVNDYGVLYKNDTEDGSPEERESEWLNRLKSANENDRIKLLEETEKKYELYFVSMVTSGAIFIRETLKEASDRTKHQLEHSVLSELENLINSSNEDISLKINRLSVIISKIRNHLFPQEFNAFFNRTRNHLQSFIIKESGDEDDLNPVWSTAFYKLMDKIRLGPSDPNGYKWLNPALMSTYFQSIAKNQWKTEKNRRSVIIHEGINRPKYMEDPFALESLRESIKNLPEPYKSVIIFYDIEGYTLKETAQMLINPKTGAPYNEGYIRTLHTEAKARLFKEIVNLERESSKKHDA